MDSLIIEIIFCLSRTRSRSGGRAVGKLGKGGTLLEACRVADERPHKRDNWMRIERYLGTCDKWRGNLLIYYQIKVQPTIIEGKSSIRMSGFLSLTGIIHLLGWTSIDVAILDL